MRTATWVMVAVLIACFVACSGTATPRKPVPHDDLSLFISRYGEPTETFSSEDEVPRPLIVTKWLIYKPEDVRMVYHAGVGEKSPIKKWTLMGSQHHSTNDVIDPAEAIIRLEARFIGEGPNPAIKARTMLPVAKKDAPAKDTKRQAAEKEPAADPSNDAIAKQREHEDVAARKNAEAEKQYDRAAAIAAEKANDEAKATRKLKLARQFSGASRKKWLAEVSKEFPGTAAAKDAEAELAKLK